MSPTEFTVGEQIQLRGGLRMRLKAALQLTLNTEFNTGVLTPEMRQAVRDTYTALMKVLDYRDDGEGVGFLDADLTEFLREIRKGH